MRNSIVFTLIPGAFLVCPAIFFTQGFVSTFSLMSNKVENENITISDSLRFIFRRLIKLMPFNAFILAVLVL